MDESLPDDQPRPLKIATAQDWSRFLDQLAVDATAARHEIAASGPDRSDATHPPTISRHVASWQPPVVATALPAELSEQAAATRAAIQETQRALGHARSELLADLQELDRRRGALHAYDAQSLTPFDSSPPLD